MTGPELKPIPVAPADFGTDPRDQDPSRWHGAFRRIVTGNGLISLLSVVLALIAGSIMIAFTNPEVQEASGYFFRRPQDTIAAVWDSISGAYVALFQGAIYNFRADSFAVGIRPLTETLKFATPLIAAGLGVGLAFRAGLFNIGGQGQMLMAAAAAGWVGTSMNLPWPLHMLVAIVAGVVAGGLWAGIAGLLKARTGAHEVIVTIMLNNIAFYLLAWMLATQGILQAPGSNNPKTAPMAESALLPGILGPQYKLHAGFILALIAVGFTWWLLERSSLGFRFRAVGENPSAAKVAGISVGKMYFLVMLIAGGLVGIAGVSQVLGTVTSGFGGDIDAGIGFDAITVALLGRSTPLGILAAGILFGAFKAGGFAMQASENVPIEIVLVVQSLIVLFIAAPPLVRAIFRLPQPGARRKPNKPATPKKNAAQPAEEVSA
ncbi:simple sugar transport system permease protein [Microbacterium ginsengiterrae]|uniref:Simple sugar transport system permease protein n=1 Tax=Microbacterium ginsengiterrae TaxID=546115 RepID=A0A7W9CA15_9MICO|nr:ABC transporter permease [Microbacterium ginsengiterrae]MBB5741814.1 simple sugar transport system permease protein [Microbacterium ginsengiterrae]